ncbi:GNAT family protein [Specibacter sp. NPDC078692]|uniref:GNAT family N-acetyltransferase n=1 Tax=Specibacter sp. NPDC078692 TaxID=3155818 RepID=UPI00343FC947
MSSSTIYPSGPRLGLRDFDVNDIADVHEYTADPLVSQFSTWEPNALKQTTAFVEAAAQEHLDPDRTAFSLAAVLDGKAIGSVAIWITDPHDRNGELGYTFHRDYWGKGYSSEAVSMLLSFGFNSLELERITATCHPENQGSVRVLEKSGFALEGRLRSHRRIRGQRRDSMLYSILRGEWSLA